MRNKTARRPAPARAERRKRKTVVAATTFAENQFEVKLNILRKLQNFRELGNFAGAERAAQKLRELEGRP